MSLTKSIHLVSKSAVLADVSDLPSLAATRDRLHALEAELEAADLDAAADCAKAATKLLAALVEGESRDAERLLDQVHRSIEYIGRVIEAHEAGRPIDGIAAPRADGSDSSGSTDWAEPIDTELLSAWISGAEEALADLEASVVAIEAGHDAEICAEIRRRLHTFKGECGVLSLRDAQRLFHAAESAVDLNLEKHAALPVDGLLALIDWTKNYVRLLARNPREIAPPHDAVLEKLAGADLEESGSAARVVVPEPLPTATVPDPEPAASPEDHEPVEFDLSSLDDTVGEFVTEAREHLTNSEQALLELDKNPRDNELINKVFRAFHTVKGVAGFMNLTPIVSLAHSGEFLLDGARTGKVQLDSRYLDLILKACDLLGQLLGALGGGARPTKGQLKSMIADLERASRGEAPGGTAATEAAVASVASVTSVTSVTSVASVASAAPLATTNPPRAAATPVPAPVAARAAPARAVDPQTSPGAEATPTHKDRAPDAPGAADSSTAASAATAAAPNAIAKRADQTVKVSTLRMDALVNMVGELVIAQQMVLQDPLIRDLEEQRLQRNLTIVGKIIRDLQQVSMSLRMVSLKGTFQKMARLVRDVSAKAGKRVELHTEGEDVELDRNVVEEIADPLVHMIRNACDHGIESSDVRLAAGKPESGNLRLRAYHSGGSIVVEIEDDGKGLDRARIIRKAVEKGLLPADRDERDISDAEAYNLVFLPGFSTAEKITDISGRGVGMDVVKRNIEALRGKVDIYSTPGKGTVFAMRLPLTMAIIDGMVVRVGSQRYVIPTLSIERSFRPVEGDVYTVLAKGEMARDRGSLLPIYRLNRVLRSNEGCQEIAAGLLIVLEAHDSRCCLMVDEIIGQQQVVIKSLGENMPRITGVSGGAILGDGRVALILDVAGIVSAATANAN